eukprot:jgi/Botrbrau1/3864/Bobra.0183s0088.2
MRASFPVKARGCFGTQATCPAVSAAGAKRFLQRRQPNRHHCKRWERRATTGEGEVSIADVEDLEAQMEDFLKKQAAKESGLVAAVELPKTPIGTETVSDEEAKEFCRQVVRMVKVLREKRDMSVNEVKLTIAIEPPSEREQREYMGIENERGVSRDEMAAALLEVAAGRVPRDRIALRELYKEMSSWPFLEEGAPAPAPDEGASPYEEITDTGSQGRRGGGGLRRAPR